MLCVLYVCIANLGVFVSEHSTGYGTLLDQLRSLLYGDAYDGNTIRIQPLVLTIMPKWLFIIFSSDRVIKGRNLERVCLMTRYNSRLIWYWKSVGKMMLEIFFFSALYLGLNLYMAKRISADEQNLDEIPIYLTIWLVLVLYVMLHCIVSNMIRIYLKAEYVSIVVIAGLLIEMAGAVLMSDISFVPIRSLNPLYFIIVFYEMSMGSFMAGMGSLVFMNIAALLFGRYAVSKADIGLFEE